MKKIALYISIILTGGLTLSCGEDFLDVKPSNSTESSVTIKTQADAKVMVNGLHRNLLSSNFYGRNFLIYGDAKGGDVTIASQGRGLDGLYVYNQDALNSSYSGFWSSGYNSLLQANNIIKSISELETSGVSNAGFLNYKGQALTIRALLHFDLVRLYGKTYTDDPNSFGIPIVTEIIDASAQPTRNSVSETYAQIVKDLSDAEVMLSKAKSNGYINYYANKALQARVYLTMGDFSKALAAAEEVINSKVYSLYTNAEWVNSWQNTFGKESIFELVVAKDQGDLGSASLGYYYLRSKDNNALGNFIASDYYLNKLNEDANDVRWGIMTNDELNRQAACYKYVGSVNKSGDKPDGPFTAVNIKMIRLSEVYLIASEAALKSGSAQKAADYLNEIRKRAPGLAPATASNVNEKMILDEKGKELYGEGHRFWDMIRTNQQITFNDEHVGVTMSHRTKTIDRTFYKTILPIPRTEINANPALESQQNPGY